MNELTKHIEALLLNHDCVIIPGLGGFVSQYVESYYIKEESSFFPPYRTVGFNPQLTLNDGLLVQSFMQTYDTSYPEAIEMIEQKVDHIMAELHKKCSCEFEGIGSLSLTLSGIYTFTPFESGVLTPTLYGLTSFQMKSASELRKQASIAETIIKENLSTKEEEPPSSILQIQKEQKHYTINVNRTIANYAVTIAAAIMIYFMFSIPVENANNFSASKNATSDGLLIGLSTLLQNEKVTHRALTNKIVIDSIDHLSLQKNAKEEALLSTVVEKDIKTEKPATVQTSEDALEYAIVVASAVTIKNATKFVKELHKQGFSNARVYQKGKMTRVLCSQYNSEKEAYKTLTKIRENESFSEAWVMSIK